MKKIYLLAIAALTLVACDRNDNNPISTIAVQVSATISENKPTRASDTSWANGDRIGITAYVGDERKYTNFEYTTEEGDGTFTGTTMYFYHPMSFTAYYPFADNEGNVPGDNGIIEVNTSSANQSSENQPGIDYLYASPTAISLNDADQPVINFTFAHQMSKLTFTFIEGDGVKLSSIISYKLDGLKLKGTFDTINGGCESKTDAEPAPLEIASLENKIENEKALDPLILLPQIPEGALTLSITDKENNMYSGTLNFPSNGFEAGKNYAFNVTVKKLSLSITTPNITQWEDGFDKPTESNATSE